MTGAERVPASEPDFEYVPVSDAPLLEPETTALLVLASMAPEEVLLPAKVPVGEENAVLLVPLAE